MYNQIKKPYMKQEGSVKCPLCGESFKRLSGSHLKFRHKITLQQFEELYPLYQTCSLEPLRTHQINSIKLDSAKHLRGTRPKKIILSKEQWEKRERNKQLAWRIHGKEIKARWAKSEKRKAVHLSQINKVGFTCLICGKDFEDVPSKERKYCSKECYDIAQRVHDIKKCGYCNRTFDAGKIHNQIFCCYKCSAAAIARGFVTKRIQT